MAETALVNQDARPQLRADRPLVTFALFAYNQECYVREAIESAFAQTYTPMEIILSDDCSSDLTFAIMQEMATAYSGPHAIVVRRSAQNRRVLRHVLDVARLARGKYMVVAAGDDISRPQRAEKLIELFERETADFCWSAYKPLQGDDLQKRYFSDDFTLTSNIYGFSVNRIHGATAAYRLSQIKKIPPIEQEIFYEDSFFEMFAEIHGLKVAFCSDHLVEYRIVENSISMKFHRDGLRFESHLANHFARLSDAVILAIGLFGSKKMMKDSSKLNQCYELAHFYKNISDWRTMSLPQRLKLLLMAPDIRALRWFLPRAVLGWDAFTYLKGLQLKRR